MVLVRSEDLRNESAVQEDAIPASVKIVVHPEPSK